MNRRRSTRNNHWRAPRRRAPYRRRPPTDEELAHAIALWALVELLPQEGDLADLARQEVKRLGIDVKSKFKDIRLITLKHFAHAGIDPEDLVQEVCLAILSRNGTKSAYDPNKSSFGHYVYLIARNVLANALERRRRWGREELGPNTVFLTASDPHTPLESFDAVEAYPPDQRHHDERAADGYLFASGHSRRCRWRRDLCGRSG